jgi:cell shape-determining protein MreD
VTGRVVRGGVALLSATVVLQFLMEVTLGRVFVAPNLMALTLVYLMLNGGTRWSIDGAFWSGLCLDLLMHQPPGASSFALMCGLYVSRRIAGASAGENRMVLLVLTAISTVVSDSVFILVVSRFRGWAAGASLLAIFPRLLLTLLAGLLAVTAGTVAGSIRRESSA